jgi:hypothetical protein
MTGSRELRSLSGDADETAGRDPGKPPVRADAAVLRYAFLVLLAATVLVLGLDYRELLEQAATEAPPVERRADLPSGPLPPARPNQGPNLPDAPDGAAAVAMTFELLGDGRLMATGSIVAGTAEAFAAEIGKRGSYVKTVVLASPGGSVADALAMGRLIREKGYATEVEAGTYCASSCPLVLAAGTERRVGASAAVGVHQVFSWADDPAARRATMADGMAQAQRISAECQRYLATMGVDPQVWVHAMETPKHTLFYFTPDEMVSLRLATSAAGATVSAASR